MRRMTLAMGILCAGVSTSAIAASDPVAVVGGTPISRAELEEHVKPRLLELEMERFEALDQGLRELIAAKLLEKEAAARGIDPAALMEAEVGSKVAEPAEGEIKQLYDANKGRIGDATLEQLRPQIVAALKQQQEAELQGELLKRLRATHKTTIALRPPTVEIGDGGRPSLGPQDAPVTIIEFSDYECPACKSAEGTLKRILGEYEKEVRLVYRNFPLDFHHNAKPAAMAAACAERQGKFWEFHDRLFGASSLNEALYKTIATDLGLDHAAFDACLASGETGAIVDKDMADGAAVGVRGTPAFFINGRMVSGLPPFDSFKEIIDQELAASGS